MGNLSQRDEKMTDQGRRRVSTKRREAGPLQTPFRSVRKGVERERRPTATPSISSLCAKEDADDLGENARSRVSVFGAEGVPETCSLSNRQERRERYRQRYKKKRKEKKNRPEKLLHITRHSPLQLLHLVVYINANER